MATSSSDSHDDMRVTPLQVTPLISEHDLIIEITALAESEHYQHRLACAHSSITVGDLISEGWLASQKAIRNYDPEQGPFLRYLRKTIKRELSDVVRVSKIGSVKVSSRTLKRLDRGELNAATAATLTSLRYTDGIAVGSAPDADGGEPQRGMVYETDMNVASEEDVVDIVLKREQAELVHLLVDELEEANPSNAQVMRLRWGLEDGIVRSNAEVAAILGTGPKNVERRYTAAMKTLRKLAEPLSLDED